MGLKSKISIKSEKSIDDILMVRMKVTMRIFLSELP
jgi:hypothetical protein